ncbi:hypothetical protein M409DRAFT_16229 [Zasmidium cellare ATCC 36951]|uniref:Heterokaryon incompatibility domain-containing protein n=1 Tax=Zasmidium cellare ATCC 36951 TaxID=1080233 RepID=A0A6A6D6K6_ZASCE|nr:uncharacterized protein M409DRAFT_16229 [Zasmidium cellare ATCC 36951]KAF2173960.1 hypothetical protein M409DRAFT_16229 [Zasmidium cellare ATCC 36951]
MDKTRNLEESLKALALKESAGSRGEQGLLDHEVEIFETSYSQLRAEPNLPDIRIRILCHALPNRNYDMVSRLLADIDEKALCVHGQLCIMKALILNNVQPGSVPGLPESMGKILALLLRHGAPAAVADEHGKCPLYFACKTGDSRTFRTLIEAGANARQLVSLNKSKYGEVQLGESKERFTQHLLQATWRSWQSAREYPHSLDHRQEDLAKGHAAIILQLLDMGLEMDTADPVLVSVYHMLCCHGHLERVKKLTSLGVSVQARGVDWNRGFSVTFALQAAAIGCQSQVVKYLLEHGASRSSKGRIYTGRWGSLNISEPERPMTALVSALYYHRSSGDIRDICRLLFDPHADEDDLRCLLYFSIEQGWMEMVKDLLARKVRVESVPLCLNTEMIDTVARHGVCLDGRRFLQYALNRGNLELLKYLEKDHGVGIDLHDFPHVALGLMRRYHYHQWARDTTRRAEYAEIMKYLLGGLLLVVNDAFRMARRTNLDVDFEDYYTLKDVSDFANCEIVSTDMDAYPPIRLGDDTSDPGVQTSLLRLACEWELYPVVRWLVEDEDADPACPGLTCCALDYYIQRPPLESRLLGDDLDERLALLLLERSRDDDVGYWEHELATHLQQNTQDVKACTTWTSSVPIPGGEGNIERVDVSRVVLPRPYSSHATPFTYVNLRGHKTIRLFHLEAAACLDDPLCGTLSDHEPIDCPPFEALSYVWGDTTEQCVISVNAKPFCITMNLAAALYRMRSPDGPRVLWVDAICINQQDNNEKSRQVSLMENIYQRATRVLVWIGEHADNSQSIFEWHESNKDKIEDDANQPKHIVSPPNFWYSEEAQTAFEAICRRNYWYRTWILQELGFGVKATVICGSDSVDLKGSFRFGQEARWLSDYHPLRGPHAIRHAERVSRLANYCDISGVATLTRCCQCKDPRDKVFGILGLLPSKPIPVHYDGPVEDVYRSFTKAIIEHRNDLLALHWLGPNRSLPGLDSWVPDWSISKPVGVLPRAHDTERLGWELKDAPDLSFSGSELTIKGARLDIIHSIGGTLSVPDDCTQTSAAFNATMLRWEQLVLAEVQKHGIKALEAFARTLHAEDDYCMDKRPGGRILFPFAMWYHHYGTGFLETEASRSFELVELAMVILAQIQDWNDWDSSMQQKIWGYTESMEVSCYGRQFYITEGGSMGLAPPGARVGDEVVFFPGSSYPFVVRRNDDGRTWEMVGDCHLEKLDVEVIKATPMEYFTLR